MRSVTSSTRTEPVTGEIQGTCSERFSRVREVLARQLANGDDIGASAAVFIDGEPVVDIYGGFLDKERTNPWQRDTIVNNFSTTKTMTALSALILADRGELDLHAPVAKYWPEFADNGKADIEVRHLLGHTAGMAGWTETVTHEDMYDWEKATTLLAQQAPWWKPGTKAGYHPLTYGPLIGEVVRRVTGKMLHTFFAEEVAGPLGADYHIGVGPELDHRVTNLIQGSPIITPTGDLIRDRAFFNPLIPPQTTGTIPWRRADLGGCNGHGNAHSVALVQSILACGGEVQGVRFMSPAGCERAFEIQADGIDLVMPMHLRWGMGYCIGTPLFKAEYGQRIEARRVACWGGSGGSWVMVDLDARMTVAYVMNLHQEHGGYDHRSVAIVNAAYDGLLGDD
jgi:CubicO group peptidase (beta-lactamase class C family)